MANDKDPITSHREISNSSPKRTRPTDRQMGLGSDDIIENSSKDKKKSHSNT